MPSSSFYGPHLTARQRAMSKLMEKQTGLPPSGAELTEQRIDSEDEMQEFCQSHDFITNVTGFGDGTYVIEYFK